MKRALFSWRKYRADVFNPPNAYELRCGGKRLAIANEIPGAGWYWYALSGPYLRNTSSNPRPLAVVKAEAAAYFRELEATQ